jgi:hypothetical protein
VHLLKEYFAHVAKVSLMKAFRVLAIVVLMAAQPSAAGAGEDTAPLSTERAFELLRQIPADMAERGTLGVLRAAAALDGLSGTTATGTVDAVSLPPSVPMSLARPVADLLAEVRFAAEEFRAAVPISPSQAQTAIERAAELAETETSSPPPALEALNRRIESQIDRGRMLAAAIRLAEAIERSLPAFQRQSHGQARAAAVGCDVADAMPALCIGGDGSNTYEESAFVHIDLGGDDVYRGAVATAAFIPPVAVSIDLSGNDHYLSVREGGQLAPVQGSAIVGIGLLLDVSGDDRYTITDGSTPNPVETILPGQGYGAIGVGVVDDRAGNDVYEARIRGQVSAGTVQVQGYGTFGGVGAVVDGAGNDSYEASSRPSAYLNHRGDSVSGNAKAEGQGYGVVGGTGILADASGNDTALLEAGTAELPPGSPSQGPPAFAGVAGGGSAGYSAGGTAGISGAGIATWGPGNTEWTLRAETVGPSAGPARIDGLGLGAFGGIGAIRDSGGDDVYRAEALSTSLVSSDSDACACAPAATASSGDALTTAIGVGVAGGVGVVDELGGNDRYEIVARSVARAEAADHRATAGGGFASAVAGQGDAQGAAAGGVGGLGTLEDRGGNDRYTGLSESRAEALVTPEGTGDVEAASAGAHTRVQAHGSVGGGALLRDLGGGDTYSSTATSVAEAPSGWEDPGPTTTSAQGSVSGGLPPLPGDPPATALVLDLGSGTDMFSATPPDPTCFGTRGGQSWQDCGPGAVGGANP